MLFWRQPLQCEVTKFLYHSLAVYKQYMSQTSQPLASNKKRVYQLDVLRFIAALSVVFYHYTFRGSMSGIVSSVRFEELNELFKYGYLGVDLFFLISGFVITLSIKSRSIQDFVLSRISRLYPAYWLGVIFTSVILYALDYSEFSFTISDVLVNLTMFQNYIDVVSVDGVYWSLFIEMKFYIFIIGAYLIANRIKTISLDYWMYSWLILALLFVFAPNSRTFTFLNQLLILEWSSYFIAGMTLYQIYASRITLAYAFTLCITLCLSLYHALARIQYLEAQFSTSFSPWYIASIVVAIYGVLLLIVYGKLQFLNTSKSITVGLLTYPLYLLHQNIGFSIFNAFGNESNRYILLCATIVFMLLLSYLISVYFEPRVSSYLKNTVKRLLLTAQKES